MSLPESLILYERDDDGVPFAVEEVRAARWDESFASLPDPAVADVRIVHLGRGPLPATTPSWLAVDLAPRSAGVAEAVTSYVIDGPSDEDTRPSRHPAQRLWARSPHFRRPSSTLDEFLRAGATALRHPEPAPTDPERQAEALRAFARGRADLAPLIDLRAVALERWLHVTFVEPEAFADAILLARVEVIDATDARLLRFVRAAMVPTTLPACADLAIDRVVLLEQASPWRYLEGTPSGSPAPGALAAARQWQRRYVRAYAAHYARVVEDCDHLLRDAEGLMARLATLEHLNGAGSLGEPEGAAAIGALRNAVATLMAMPAEPDPHAATTAGVHLGAGNPTAEAFRVAAADVDRALEARLRRLSAGLAACALTQDDDLAAIRHAIAVSEVDHLDRVLDDRLTARIDGLLRGAARSPLALVARQFPEVTRDNLDAAVAEFRRAALRAIELAPDGRTALGSISPGVEAAG